MEKLKVLIAALSVLLMLALGYIANGKLEAIRTDAGKEGYGQGITAAVVAAYQQTENCQVATITMGNLTKQVVDVECVRMLLENKGVPVESSNEQGK
ncbi:hypothetical protein HYU11_03650 [Candidatus Woesearchaeota archaeon]|nr:hypothetical protein [Candidatus Woesearchaeota archaeon]